ncbi:MAG: hypothetical protein IJR72_01075 [Oscillospiraceae bacterium]|nr:hypothetical protein [Oscillospiraceae bacterium]
MRNKLRGIALILFGFLVVYTMNLWDPWIPVVPENVFLGICDIIGLVFGIAGVLSACRPDDPY